MSKIKYLVALLAMCLCCVVTVTVKANASAVTIAPDGAGEAVNLTITETAWDGQNISIVLYTPGYDATAKNLTANAAYISYIGQTKVNGQTNVRLPLKGKVEKGNYTLVLGTKSGKVTKTFTFYPQSTATAAPSKTPEPSTTVTPKTSPKVTLKKPSIKVKAGKKYATVSWKRDKKASGYKVYMSTKKKGKFKVVATIKKNKTVKVKIKKLKKGKKYYFKVTAYQTFGNKKVESKASVVKSVKVK